MRYEIILDSGETANKCTIAPLSDRGDFRIFPVKQGQRLGPLKSQILLHHQGQCLTEIKKSLGQVQAIASIDCVWHRLDSLIRRIEGECPTLARIPDGFQTVYPRHNKKGTDPDNSLATIEAIFIAAGLLGHWDLSLLSKYHFAGKFLEVNKSRFLELGVAQAAAKPVLPLPLNQTRNAFQRRLNRGKIKI